MKSTEVLHDILYHYRSPFDKSGISFNITKEGEGESSKLLQKNTKNKPRSHRGSRQQNYDHKGPIRTTSLRTPKSTQVSKYIS